MKVKYEASFEKDLRNILNKNLLQRIRKVIEEVKQAEDTRQISNFKKLKGYDAFYRIKLGDYRIGIEIVNNEAVFVRFLHRREVYRFFP